MLRKICFVLIAALFCTCFTLGMDSAEAKKVKEPITIKVRVGLNLKHRYLLGNALDKFKELVEERSKGDILIDLTNDAPDGKYADRLDEVQRGYLENDPDAAAAVCYLGQDVYDAKKLFHVYYSMPFSLYPWDMLDWLDNYGGMKLLEQQMIKYGIVPVLTVMIAPEMSGFWPAKFESLEEWRTYGLGDIPTWEVRYLGIGGDVVRNVLNRDDVIVQTALSLGDTINLAKGGKALGFEFSTAPGDFDIFINDQLGLAPLTPWNPASAGMSYYYLSGWHQRAGNCPIFFNKKFWHKELNGKQRRLIKEAAREALEFALSQAEGLVGDYTVVDGDVLPTSGALLAWENETPSMDIVDWPPEIFAAFLAESNKILDDLAYDPTYPGYDKEIAKYLESIRAYKVLKGYEY